MTKTSSLTGLPVLPEGSLRLAPLASLHGLAVRHRLPMADRLTDPENIATLAEAGRFLAELARATGFEHVGLLADPGLSLDSLGPIGALARGARDVGAALRGLILVLHLHDRGTVASLQVADGRATLGTVALAATDLEGAAYVADITMVACFNILRALCGADWRADEVHLARRAPRDPRPWTALFRVQPTFDAERNALVFDAAWLARPLVAGPADASPFEALGALHPLDLPARVRRACVRAIIEGEAAVGRVAEIEGTSRRTLNRRLAAAGTTAQAELALVKLSMAKQLLEATDLPLTTIAHLLDYGDGAAFTRAFRAAVGIPPSQWRDRAIGPACQ